MVSIPDLLAKQLLKQFGLPYRLAPGEAEAECALLQQKGVVDAVLSEDVDTLMFGSGLTLRNWSPEGSLKSKVPTHVNVYDAKETKAGKSQLDREGMILVAMMSGGDYAPEGIPGCGPKTACEAARAGFGADLCKLSRKDTSGIAAWKQKLCHELKTNESKFFRSKHAALVIPEDFPRLDILGYYTHPALSSDESVENYRDTLKWDQDFDIPALRIFVGEAFEWICLSGGKKFIRNLAPALLVRQLRLEAEKELSGINNEEETSIREARLIKQIHMKRNHVTTDGVAELRVSFIPNDLVKLDLDAEEPDPEVLDEAFDSEEEGLIAGEEVEGAEEPSSPKKKRAPSKYNPTIPEKVWLLETFVKVGVPLKVQDWEEKMRAAARLEAARATKKRAPKSSKASANGDMPRGALNGFARVTKPGISLVKSKAKSQTPELVDILVNSAPSVSSQQSQLPRQPQRQPASVVTNRPVFRLPQTVPEELLSTQAVMVDVFSSPERTPRPAKRSLRRSQSDTSTFTKEVTIEPTERSLAGIDSTANGSIDSIVEAALELPSSVTVRRHRSPFRETQSLATHFDDDELTFMGEARGPAYRPSSPDLPDVLDLIPRPSTTVHRPSTTQTKIDNLIAAPTTPRRKQKPKENVITINSSPATPKSQRTIRECFAATPTPRRVALVVPPLQILPDHDKDTSFPLPPVSTFSLTACRKKTASTEVEHVEASKTSSLTTLAFNQRVQTTKEVIRLRDSLHGAWRAGPEDGQEQEATASNKPPTPEKKRKRVGQRQWRVSQVETLDLTEA